MMWDTYNARSLTLLGSDFGINLHFLDPLYANTSIFENATNLEIRSTHMRTSRWWFWAFQMLFIGLRTLRLHHIVSGHMTKVQIWNESRWDELSTPVNRTLGHFCCFLFVSSALRLSKFQVNLWHFRDLLPPPLSFSVRTGLHHTNICSAPRKRFLYI